MKVTSWTNDNDDDDDDDKCCWLQSYVSNEVTTELPHVSRSRRRAYQWRPCLTGELAALPGTETATSAFQRRPSLCRRPETDHTLDQPNASEPRCDAPSLGLAVRLPRTCQITRQSSSIFIYNTVNLIGLPVACGFRHVKTFNRDTGIQRWRERER